MKKINILLVFVLYLSCLCSCDNVIDDNIGDKEKVLVVNSLINASNYKNTIHLSLSNNRKLECLPTDDAKVELFMNNEVVAIGEFVKKTKTASEYELYYDFKENDKFEIVVKYANFRASAELEVLPAPTLVNVDTIYREPIIGTIYEHGSYIGCKVDIKDRPNEDNYYRISAELEMKLMAADKASFYGIFSYPISLCNSSDFIMNKESDDEETDIFEMGGFYNYINIFTDNFFKDKNATLNLDLMRNNFFVYIRNGRFYMEAKVRFYFFNMTKDEYKYRKISSIFSQHGSGTADFYEPYVLPDNINGGIGYIGVSAADVFEFPIFNGVIDIPDSIL